MAAARAAAVAAAKAVVARAIAARADAGCRALTRSAALDRAAADYAALRPPYPADVVGFLLGEAPRRVLDLGAGTGLLTDRLVAAGHEVVGVVTRPDAPSGRGKKLRPSPVAVRAEEDPGTEAGAR